MPKNDQETFAYLTSQTDTSYEINLLTYALFADEKAKWVEHFCQAEWYLPIRGGHGGLDIGYYGPIF